MAQQPLVLTWPKSPHSLRVLQEGEALIITLVLHKDNGDQMIPLHDLPAHIRLKDIEQAWKDDWEQIYERLETVTTPYEAVRVIRIPERNCVLVWALQHRKGHPGDLFQARSGLATDDELIAAYFDKSPAIAQMD